MKRLKMITLSVLCVAVLMIGGCGKKQQRTAEEFDVFMKDKGFSVYDCAEQFADYDYVQKALVASSDDGSYQIEFYELSDDDGARSFYSQNYSILSEHEDDASSHVESSSSSYQNYEITGTEGYGCVSRIGNTVFYAVVDKDYKDEVKSLKSEFGY